jgi:hypothetical protein
VAALRNEICQLRSEAKVRGVIEAMADRLDKIEAAAERSPLRAAAKLRA